MHQHSSDDVCRCNNHDDFCDCDLNNHFSRLHSFHDDDFCNCKQANFRRTRNSPPFRKLTPLRRLGDSLNHRNADSAHSHKRNDHKESSPACDTGKNIVIHIHLKD